MSKEMMAKHRSGTEKESEEAEHIAHVLLYSLEEGYLGWAEEAVRVVEMGIASLPAGEEPTKGTKTLLKQAQGVLRTAKGDAAVQEAAEEGEEEEEGEELQLSEDDILLYSEETGWLMDEPATGMAADEPATDTAMAEAEQIDKSAPAKSTAAPASARAAKPSRRVDSTRDVEQEWDEASQQWVDVGPVAGPLIGRRG